MKRLGKSKFFIDFTTLYTPCLASLLHYSVLTLSHLRATWGQWLCPLEASLSPFLSIRSELQRASPIDIISDDKGVIYSGGTRIATDLVQNSFSLWMHNLCKKQRFLQFKNLRERILLKMMLINVYFPRQNISCQIVSQTPMCTKQLDFYMYDFSSDFSDTWKSLILRFHDTTGEAHVTNLKQKEND